MEPDVPMLCSQDCHLSLCLSRLIQPSSPTLILYSRSILILSVYRSLSCKWSPSLRFPHQTLHVFLFSLIHATCEAHLNLLDLNTLICGEKYKLWSCSFLRFIQPNLSTRPKCRPQRPSLEHPQTTSFLSCDRPSFATLQSNRHD